MSLPNLSEEEKGEEPLAWESSSFSRNKSISKVVSFTSLDRLHKIPSRHDFSLKEVQDMWYEKRDVTYFARIEMVRRQNLGITDTSMLAPSASYIDEDDDDDSCDDGLEMIF